MNKMSNKMAKMIWHAVERRGIFWMEAKTKFIFAGLRGDLLSGGRRFDAASQRKKQAPGRPYICPNTLISFRWTACMEYISFNYFDCHSLWDVPNVQKRNWKLFYKCISAQLLMDYIFFKLLCMQKRAAAKRTQRHKMLIITVLYSRRNIRCP